MSRAPGRHSRNHGDHTQDKSSGHANLGARSVAHIALDLRPSALLRRGSRYSFSAGLTQTHQPCFPMQSSLTEAPSRVELPY